MDSVSLWSGKMVKYVSEVREDMQVVGVKEENAEYRKRDTADLLR